MGINTDISKRESRRREWGEGGDESGCTKGSRISKRSGQQVMEKKNRCGRRVSATEDQQAETRSLRSRKITYIGGYASEQDKGERDRREREKQDECCGER